MTLRAPFLCALLALTFTLGFRTAEAAEGKPAIKHYYRTFVSALRHTDQATGRIAPAALARLVAASDHVKEAATSIGEREQNRTALHEVAYIQEVTDRIRGSGMISEGDVPAIEKAFTDLGVVAPDTAAHRSFRRELDGAAAKVPNVSLRKNEIHWDMTKNKVWFPAQARLTLDRPHDGAAPIVVELDPSRCRVDTAKVVAMVGGEEVMLKSKDVKIDHGRMIMSAPKGTKKIAVQYQVKAVTLAEGSSGLLRSNDGKAYATLTWPYHQGKIGPAISSPNDKVQVDIEAKAPSRAVVMNNAAQRGGPSYNGAIVVLDGYEKTESKAPNGLPIELWQRPGTANKATQKAIFNNVSKAVKFLTDKLGELPPIPNGRLRYVEGIGDGFSMEHDGLIAMTPSQLADPKQGPITAVHELTHHVFGNSVRAKNWDFWRNEGTTDYYTNRALEDIHGAKLAHDTWRRFATQAARALARSGHPLVNPMGTDVQEVFDDTTYKYGAWMMRMIEGQLGREEFDRVMKDYVGKFAGKAADSRDFARFLTKNNTRGVDVASFISKWNGLTQIPRVRIGGLHYEDAGKTLCMDLLDMAPMPTGITIPVRVTFKNGTQQTFDLDVSKRTDGYKRTFTSAISRVEFDPEQTMLVATEVHRGRSS